MRAVVAFVRFWYEFVIGDDWTIAAIVAAALVVTFVLAHRAVTAWFVLPALVAAGLTGSLWRATAPSGDGSRHASAGDDDPSGHAGVDDRGAVDG